MTKTDIHFRTYKNDNEIVIVQRSTDIIKTFDYTAIPDPLWEVSWSYNNHQTVLLYESNFSTSPKDAYLKRNCKNTTSLLKETNGGLKRICHKIPFLIHLVFIKFPFLKSDLFKLQTSLQVRGKNYIQIYKDIGLSRAMFFSIGIILTLCKTTQPHC